MAFDATEHIIGSRCGLFLIPTISSGRGESRCVYAGPYHLHEERAKATFACNLDKLAHVFKGRDFRRLRPRT